MLKLVAAPTAEPVTAAEVRANVRFTSTAEDTLIDAMITAARERAEHELGLRLLEQTVEWMLPEFPASDTIIVEAGPLISLDSIKYIDTTGAEQTYAASNVYLDGDVEPGRIYIKLKSTASWPSTADDVITAVRIRLVVGYGDEAAAVPMSIRRWINVHASTAFKHRENTVVGTIVTVVPDRALDSLLDPHKAVRC